jgi:TRAP-type C4-dicarboxylate transport system permease small subunit
MRWIQAVVVVLFAWIAVRSAWLDMTLSPGADGTPLQSLVYFVLLPLSLGVLFAAIRDVRRLREQSRDVLGWLTLLAEVIGLTALGVLLLS